MIRHDKSSMNRMPFTPGQKKVGGRTRGIPNKVTCDVKAAARKASIPAMKKRPSPP